MVKKQNTGFQGLGLSPEVLRGVLGMGYKQPTPVQRKVLPVALAGKDLTCMARTGSGKTAAFLIPMLEAIVAKRGASRDGDVMAVVLSPTRELALQTYKFSTKMAKYLSPRLVQAAIVGGESVEEQFRQLARRPAALIATPGRLEHLLEEVPKSLLNLSTARVAIFDEADRLFEMGFAEQLGSLLAAMASERQTLLFSATMPRALAQFARAGLRDDVELVRLEAEAQLSETLRCGFLVTRSAEKPAALCAVLRKVLPNPKELTLVFVATRHHCELLTAIAHAVFPERHATMIYGAMDQEARTANLRAFRQGHKPLLFVTDVAARGLDVPLVDHVVNYSFPSAARLFVHRAGRAARQGRDGLALSLVEPDELAYMVELHELIDKEPADASAARTPSYSRDDGQWTVADVHYGRVPQDALDMELHSLHAAAQVDDGTIKAMTRVCANAMEQYRRTRPQPHAKAIRRAKNLKLHMVHPLFTTPAATSADGGGGAGGPAAAAEAAAAAARTGDAASAALLREQLHAYRPLQTILEVATATGSKGHDAAEGMSKAVRGFKRKADFAAAMAELPQLQQEEPEDGDDGPEESTTPEPPRPVINEKRRLSKAERKRLKLTTPVDQSSSSSSLSSRPQQPSANARHGQASSSSSSSSFKDAEHYIEYGRSNIGEMEEVLGHRTSAGDGAASNAAARLEAALLDVAPDDALAMAKKQKMFKWDSRKRKYVQQTVGELTAGKRRGEKKLRTESGAVVSSMKATAQTGEIYRKWAEKHKRGTGADDDADHGAAEDGDAIKADYRARGPGGTKRPGRRGVAPGAKSSSATDPKPVRDEIKTPQQIAKAKTEKARMQLKNMPKQKRRALTQKAKVASGTATGGGKGGGGKGGKGGRGKGGGGSKGGGGGGRGRGGGGKGGGRGGGRKGGRR